MFIAHIDKNSNLQTSTEHCRSTAEMSGNKLSSVGLNNLGYLTGLLHDCGKFTQKFSDYIIRSANGEKTHKGEVIHSFAGVYLMLNRYHGKEKTDYERLTAELVAVAIGSHHGLFDCISSDFLSGFEHRLNKQPAYEKEAINGFLDECATYEELDSLFTNATAEVTNFLDQLSPICTSKTEPSFYFSLLARLLTSAVVDSDKTDTAAFMQGITQASDYDSEKIFSDCLSELHAYLSGFDNSTPLNAARKQLSDICFEVAGQKHGLFRLNIPTGGGKTLSGLRFALKHAVEHKKQRIILISPLLSILEQNAKVVRNAIKNDSVILEHHSNVVNDSESQNDELQDAQWLIDTWNSPIIITTLVQFLNTLFLGKMSSVRRFSSLQNSVIVLDEVQTVPNHMLSLFNLAVDFIVNQMNGTVVLCSATQPELADIKDHKLHTKPVEIVSQKTRADLSPVFERTKIIDAGDVTSQNISDKVLRLFNDTDSLLVVCNKKAEAEELYNSITANNDILCFHLSAGMCMKHRLDTLAQINQALYDKKHVLCISTQVIEAGVDISFSTVVRYAAGLDNIIQAAGRCNRNGELEGLAPVYIINLKDEDLSKLKDIKMARDVILKVLYNVHEFGHFNGDLASDEAISFYYNKLYSGMNTGYCDYSLKSMPSIFSLLSDNSQWNVNKPDYYLCQAFRTAGEEFKALDDSQISVIVPYKEGKELMEELEIAILQNKDAVTIKSLIDKCKQYCVSIPSYKRCEMQKQGGITGLLNDNVFLLNEAFYDNSTGVIYNEKEVNNICNSLIL